MSDEKTTQHYVKLYVRFDDQVTRKQARKRVMDILDQVDVQSWGVAGLIVMEKYP